MEKTTKKRKMLIIQIHEDLHKEIKTTAALCNISMSLLVHKAVYRYLRKSEEEKPLS